MIVGVQWDDSSVDAFDRGYFERQYGQRPWRARGDRPIMYRTLLRKLPLKRGRLLDVGCGEGHFARRAANRFDVTAVDVSAAAVAAAQANAGPRMDIRRASACELPFGESSYEVVVCLDVVEHLPEPDLFFLEARRVLAPNGFLFFSTPNPNSFGHHVKGSRSFIYRDATHVSIHRADEWKRLAENAGFEVRRLGSDTLWDGPYFSRGRFGAVERGIFTVISQAAWTVDVIFPWTRGENVVCLAQAQ